MARKKKGRSVKRNSQFASTEPETLTRAPHSFVIHRGFVGKYIRQLTLDFRKIMEPFTASSLVVRKKNTIKDFVSVAGVLHVSHLVMFTCTEISAYMRLARLPQGPTLTFRVHNYTLARDVVSSLKKQMPHNKYYDDPPLVVLNGFSTGAKPDPSNNHMKLMTTMFQGMFPTINVTKVNLNKVRRCLLFNYDAKTKNIDLRHYGIRVSPVGLSRGIKKLVKGKIPDLSRFNDMSDFVLNADQLSESEAEDDENSHVTLPQRMASRGNLTANKSAIKLTEIGPRLTLQLIKVEGGLLDGEVMFHEYIVKTPEEIAIIEKRREEKRKLKEKRKRQQEKNVKEKQQKKEEMKKKSLEGIQKMKKQIKSEESEQKELKGKDEIDDDEEEEEEYKEQEEEEDDDAEWYRKEVGEEPEPELFNRSDQHSVKRKRDTFKFHQNKKHRGNSSGDFRNQSRDFGDKLQGRNRQQRQNGPQGQTRYQGQNRQGQKRYEGQNRHGGQNRQQGQNRNGGQNRQQGQRPARKRVMGSKVHKGKRF